MPVGLETAFAVCPAQTPLEIPPKARHAPRSLLRCTSPLFSLVAQVEGGDGGGKLWGAGKASQFISDTDCSSNMTSRWEMLYRYRQKAGQEKTNCQQHRMSWKEDEDKGISSGTTSSSGCICASTKRRTRAQSLEPESNFPKEGDEFNFFSLMSVSAAIGLGVRARLAVRSQL